MGLTSFEWFQAIGWSLTFLGAIGVFLWNRGRSEGAQHKRIRDVEQRMDDADARSSKLSSYVHELATQKDTTELWHAISEERKDIAHIRERLAALESHR